MENMRISKLRSRLAILCAGAAIGLTAVVYLTETTARIHYPVILFCAGLFIGLLTKWDSVVLLQKAACFYLIGTFVNLAGFEPMVMNLFNEEVTTSYSVIVVFLWAFAFLFGRFDIVTFTRSNLKKFCIVILPPVGIITGHILVLYPLLARFYGYGFEHNLGTLKNISLFVLLFILSWGMLDNLVMRRVIMVIVIITLLLSL